MHRGWMVMAGLFLTAPAFGQEPTHWHAGDLQIQLERLLNTGRVLYVAAHPDDENTRLLAYMANGLHLESAYLSMTRGGGGQNLVGSEQAELLGVLRTQELLAARRRDGAEQRFTRARDFGYSKNPEETLKKWDHDEALADVVWVMRTFRPDVIITRFSETGRNHGHHTASAVLAREAFHAAGDPDVFPEQLKNGVKAWRPQRLMYNVAAWRADPKELAEKYMSVDAGTYDPRLGLSYGEVAAISRSMHKSQGFGSSGRRGEQLEFFEPKAGSTPDKEPFDNLDFGWGRFNGGPLVLKDLHAAKEAYDPRRPERMVPHLLKAYQKLLQLEKKTQSPRMVAKRRATAEVIAAAMGLFIQPWAERPEAIAGTSVSVELEVVKRRPGKVVLSRVVWPQGVSTVQKALEDNKREQIKETVSLAADARVSSPYWLAKTSGPSRYLVTDSRKVGQPDADTLTAELDLLLDGVRITLERPLLYRKSDPVQGERHQRFQVGPVATVTPVSTNVMFPNQSTQEVQLLVRAGQDDFKGKVRLAVPPKWRVKPKVHKVNLASAGDTIPITFSVTPPKKAAEPVTVRPEVEDAKGQITRYRADVIDYPHIPAQVLFRPSEMRFVPFSLRIPKGRIGYVPGSGDSVAENLRQVGFKVEEIDPDALLAGKLSKYKTIVLGIRAYNTRKDLPGAYAALMAWVKKGGTLITQYNTNNRWRSLKMPLGPKPFKIDRGRVTDEAAKMTPIDPKHPAVTTPNRLVDADYWGWVQERGLYFAETWDEAYQPVFRMNDLGEEPLEGALIAMKHGKGAFVYTGISFFRQLPAGVPGAYRLFANLMALGTSL